MNETILIIDDEKQVLRMLTTTLQLPNYTIVTALGGPAGIEAYKRDRPAITFVDLWMPNKDGFQVLKEIRAQDPDAEVILMTSHSDNDTVLAALRAYASDFVLKPIGHDVMDNVLRRAEERLQVKRKLHTAQTALHTAHAELEQQIATRTTELQAANAALRESEARYRELAGSITDIFFAMDQDLRYTFWNQASERLTGIAAEDALGKTIYELFPDEAGNKAAAMYRDVIVTHHPRTFINEYHLGDTDIYFEINAYPTQQGVSVFVKDITERKQMEKALRKSQERYASFVSQSHEAIYCTEFDQPIDTSLPVEKQIDAIYQNAYMGECNQAMATMYNLPSRETLIGQRLIEFHGGKDNPVNRAAFRKFIESGYRTTNNETEEVTPQGDKRFFLSNDIGIVENGFLLRIWGTAADITERKQAEAALRISEERFRQVSALTTDIIFSCRHQPDTGYTIDWLTGAAEATLGYTLAEIMALGCWGRLVVDADWPLFEQHVLALPPGQSSECEMRLHKKNGDIAWMAVYTRCVPSSDDPTQPQLFGALVDITERKRADEELANTKALLQTAFEQSPVPMTLVSMPDVTIRIVNPAALEFLGMNDEPSVIGTSLLDLNPSFKDFDRDGNPGLVKDLPLARALRGERTINEERRIVRKDGTSRWELVTGVPIYNERGEILAGYLIMMDITERKLAEAARRESEERFRIAFQTSPDAIIITQLNGLCLEVNEGFSRLTGYTREEVIGHSPLELGTWADPGDRDRLIAGLQTVGVIENMEIQFYRKDGEVRVGLLSSRALRLEGEVCILSIIRDITEWRHLEQQLRRQERLAAVGQLAAGIAHDFRNLLTTIMLYAQLSMRKPGVPPQVGEALEIIQGESQKAATLVQQILDFSSRAMVKLRPLDLGNGITEIAATLQRTLPENIRLTVTTGIEDYTIAGDMGQLQQVLLNLALNSRDAMSAGGDLRFTLSRLTTRPDETPPVADMPPGSWVCLTVADTGTGMSDAVAAHLFEPFFTTKEVGKGTGLGLAQVYGIVRQHRGYIGVKTAEGAGTTFTLYLPASHAAPIAVEPLPTAPPGQGETILLVEDNDKLRAAGESLLETLGYHVITATHGREALELYAAAGSQIDLVITDIVMPEMGGKELLSELRRLAPQVKALGVTGYAMLENMETLQQAGFLDVLHKPFDIETLAQVIRRALATPGEP